MNATATHILKFLLFVICLVGIFGYMIYLDYQDYQTYKKQEGLKKLGRKVSKTINQVSKHTKQIAKSATSIKAILEILKCPVSIFSNIQKCAAYYFRDKLFQLVWIILWVVNFIVIFIPVFVLDKIVCLTFRKCWNISPFDVCISKKSFFKFVENIYYLMSGGGRYLHRNSKDIKQCYCTPPVVFLFDPLRKFKSYFEVVVDSAPNYAALLVPTGILGILLYTNKT